eukprot:6214096-Pleurochrysis_carterae.AAC.4
MRTCAIRSDPIGFKGHDPPDVIMCLVAAIANRYCDRGKLLVSKFYRAQRLHSRYVVLAVHTLRV